METTTAPVLAAFEIGKTYSCRSVCDHNCIWEFKLIARTATRVTVEGFGLGGKPATRKIRTTYGQESIKPFGSYSMAPILRA